ncbi:uncharacterized protein LOC142863487 [Microcebus murinus]|uniref:uncharacterized protein LOC142863487 n=1 Tax=Microcebus murinus TaxID=30608 RepID=UPI003F6D9EC6
MPGVPGPGPELAAALEEHLGRALEELHAVAEAGRVAVTQAAEAAVAAVEPVAQAAEELRAETVALSRRLDALGRQVEVLSLRLGVPLVPDLEPELEPSELLLAAADPEAFFQAAEDAGTPVAHPPAFSTRRRSSAGTARSSSLVSSSGLWDRVVLSQVLPLLRDLKCVTTFSEPQFTYLYYRGLGCSQTEARRCQASALRHEWPSPPVPGPPPHAGQASLKQLPPRLSLPL